MARRIFQMFSLMALRDDERGASMMEYALLLSLIAIAAVSSVQNLGEQSTRTIDLVGNRLMDVNMCAGVNGATCNVKPPIPTP